MKWAAIILIPLIALQAVSQVRRENQERLVPTLLDKESRITDPQVQKVKALFQTIETAIVEGNVDVFSNRFDKQVFVNISKGESGYFSSDQASSLLQHYMATRKVVSFKFTRLNEKGLTPYATGRLVSICRGSHESAQIYVSCSLQSAQWVIGQFNIY
jgi:hypothetical protein